ncbi:hypothetical protein ACF09J_34860 [Streptomyces sp. NPDC014889]|uniref:hypothetical protein n=1 Tax=Streptomyces sp. NPDC014889 TaxID=3364928 RepID=UPI0037023123
MGAQEEGDGGLPRLRGLGGVDHVAGLLVVPLFHQGHDLDLAAVEEPVADATVLGHGLGRLGPPADAREGAGAVHEQGDPQLLTHLAVIAFRAGQSGQVDSAAVYLGLLPLPGSAVEADQQVVGGLALAVAGQQPGEVDQRHQRHDGGRSVQAPGVGKDLVLSPAQVGGQVGQADVGGDQRGVVEDPAGAGHQIVVARTCGCDGQPGEVVDALL